MNELLESLRGAAADPRFYGALAAALLSAVSTYVVWRLTRAAGSLALAGARWVFTHGELCREILQAIDGAGWYTANGVVNRARGVVVRFKEPGLVVIRGQDALALLSPRECRALFARARKIHAQLVALEREAERAQALDRLRAGGTARAVFRPERAAEDEEIVLGDLDPVADPEPQDGCPALPTFTRDDHHPSHPSA